jgi:hypothetical protein
MTFNPSDDLKEHINDADIMSYRTTDGSYIIAEEVDYEEALNITYVASPLELIISGRGKSHLKPWLMSDEAEVVEIFGDKIVGRTETPFELKMHYHRYFITERLMGILTKQEMETLLNEMFKPEVDKQDLTEDNEWIPDNGISKGKSSVDVHMEWRKRHQGN